MIRGSSSLFDVWENFREEENMVSIKDVARQAGVAISTVSKVLNHYPNVSGETREKVNRAIQELDFVPNAMASALSSKQAGRVALLLDLNMRVQAIDEINMQYISGAINRAMELNLDVITVFFSMIKEKSPEEMIRYFQSQSIAGIIIYGLSRKERALHELIASGCFKIVVIDAPIVGENTSSIWIDQRRAQYDVARKTTEENDGKRLFYIAGKKDQYVTQERLRGIRHLKEEMGLSVYVRYGNFSELQARNLTFRYGHNWDIIVCASDIMAIGAMKALTEMDIFRPVCGFDGIMLMGYAGKQMYTVRQNFARISAEAVTELNRLLEGGEGQNMRMDYEIVRMQYLDIIC